MKKNIGKLIIICLLGLLFVTPLIGCDKVDTTSSAVVKIFVDSPLEDKDIVFTPSRGKVSVSGKIFTVNLSDRVPFTFSVSAEGYESYSAVISALDLASGSYTNTVKLSTKLGAVLSLNVSVSDSAVVTSSNEKVVITNTANKFVATFPTRSKDSETTLTVSAEGLASREYKITEKDIKSGYAFIDCLLVANGKYLLEKKIDERYHHEESTIYSLSYNSYTGKRVGNSCFFEVGAQEEFVIGDTHDDRITPIYINVAELTDPYGAPAFSEPSNYDQYDRPLAGDDNPLATKELFVSSSVAQSAIRYAWFVSGDNGWYRPNLLRRRSFYEDQYFFKVEGACDIVAFDTNYLNNESVDMYSFSVTQEDIAKKREYPFLDEFTKLIGSPVKTAVTKKYINGRTGESVDESNAINPEKFYDTYETTISYNGTSFLKAAIVEPIFKMEFNFDANGIQYDFLKASLSGVGYNMNPFEPVEIKNGKIALDKAAVSFLNSMVCIEVAAYNKVLSGDVSFEGEPIYNEIFLLNERFYFNIKETDFVNGVFCPAQSKRLTGYIRVNTGINGNNDIESYVNEHNWLGELKCSPVEISSPSDCKVVKDSHPHWLNNNDFAYYVKPNVTFKMAFTSTRDKNFEMRSETTFTAVSLAESKKDITELKFVVTGEATKPNDQHDDGKF